MAVIATKTTTVGDTNCLILDPAQAFVLPFNIGEDWTRIRVGMALGYTSDSAINSNMNGYGNPTIVASSDKDRVHYGVKRISPGFPSEDNQPFVGIRTGGPSTFISFPNATFDHRNEHGVYTYLGVVHPNQNEDGLKRDTAINNSIGMVSPSSQNNQTSVFAGLYTFYLEIVNKGQYNQKIIVKYSNLQITDMSRFSIRNFMNSQPLVNIGTLEFNQSGSPYDLPNSFFIYNPLPTIRTRIFALGCLKEK